MEFYDFLRCVHIHLENILYKYGWNHNLENKVICNYMTGGLCIRRTSKLLLYNEFRGCMLQNA